MVEVEDLLQVVEQVLVEQVLHLGQTMEQQIEEVVVEVTEMLLLELVALV